jgi:apoptosis-inducing factor 3
MSANAAILTGPDFAAGVPRAAIPLDRPLAGRVGDEPVLLSLLNGEYYAIGGTCTHYGGPLAEGLIVGETVRCPWHHACFSLRTGEALAAPAFDALARWRVEAEGEVVFVREVTPNALPKVGGAKRHADLARILIVGGGAAGFAAAEMLRRRGYAGELTMVSDDASSPCDRPNLSKDYLAGSAPREWIPLKGPEFYRDKDIDLRLATHVTDIDLAGRQAMIRDGGALPFDALLLATGSEPIRLATPGFDRPNVHVLRSLADAEAIINATHGASRAVVVGASFIGLEVAASFRTRGLEVHVVAPDAIPMERVLGPQLGGYIRSVHERRGVIFHLGQTVQSFAEGRLQLSGGETVLTDLVVLGVGVRPRIELAERAGLTTDRGVVVDAFMRTSQPAIYAAGDIARYPDARSGELIRVEHWVAAERQGQAAALSMLGEGQPFTAPPFFWSNHYDEVAIHYVGHASKVDQIQVDGSVEAADATVRFLLGGRLMAAASLGRDMESLEIEFGMEGEGRRHDASAPPEVGIRAPTVDS